MQINYDVWGSSDTWRTSVVYPTAKYGASGRSTFKNVMQSGYCNIENPDKSAAFWGIGEGSIFTNPQYISPYVVDGTHYADVRPVTKKESKPLFFSPSQLTQTYYRYNNRFKPLVSAENLPTNVGGINLNVLLDYNYQQLIITPLLSAIGENDDPYNSAHWFSLTGYFTNNGYQTYPKIVEFSYRMRVGSTPRTAEQGLKPLYIANVLGYNATLGTKIFYGKQGFSEFVAGTDHGDNTNYANPMYYGDNYRRIAIDNTINTPDSAFANRYCTSDDNTRVQWFYFDPDNPLWSINKTTPDGTQWEVYPYIRCTDDNKDDVKKYVLSQFAYFGIPFAETDSIAQTGNFGDTGLYLPVFDENGITTGEYKDGADALLLPNAQWTDGREGAGYDPDKTPDADLDNVTGRNLNYWASSKYYLMTQDDLNKFLHIVNGLYTGGSTPTEKAEEIQNMQVDFKGSNPSDYIVALYGLPFQWVWPRTSFQPVMLGPVEVLPNDVESDTAVMQVNPDSDCTLLFGEISVPALGNFMDYAPYTKMMLYVPFVGTIDIDPVDYAGQTMRVEGTLDKQTGELAIRVMRNGVTVTNTLTANLYIQIPITAQAMGNYANNLHQLQMAGFNRSLGNLTGAVTGGVSIGAAAAASGDSGGGGTGGLSPTAPISMAANLISLPITMADYDYRITHCQPSVFYSSSASSANQAKFYRKCKLFIKRPVMLSSYTTDDGKAAYAHTVGHACSIIGTITDSGVSGFCQIGSIDLSGIPATVEEINAIKQALSKGVYV